MDVVGAYDAKTRLPELLKRVEKGERITITRHGVPVAILQPPDTAPAAAPEKTIAALRRFRTKHALDGLTVRELIEEGRR
ncbi:type II toxin-antitoxin system Phd/YefM family antitoxin [Geoalkalibacter halelectricus]|uniref:Antitoxin n=1 Tax=Geoalkalibacter halelectricus TaxID=2847045 RepID=A0ABY5ZQE5_9BACT|nr:type II toxin-antitoxin system prevent-host-death family antitoxin [Geoalkalibacter halelectricus]MDO3378576.1 type II toxin-antitoxin system prevent-host-death family antitoxin [Geoalkalibacter halelectricus]UWZ80110.1 type II toxin-antitoxin system prevent-host-death family antitoxin [Geoalkalibacter halelectricus]